MRLHILLLLSVVLNTALGLGQTCSVRYLHRVFSASVCQENICYGEAKRWIVPFRSEQLYLDLYVPKDDSLSERPLMIWIHPGGFLTGDKQADDMVALCDSFARHGYVTASLNYRMGFNPLSYKSAERAVYRGTQDARTAVRFLKQNALKYGIDTSMILLGGSSAGALATLHAVFTDDEEVPKSCRGRMFAPDLGLLDNTGNAAYPPFSVQGIINLWGALRDSTYIQADEKIPTLSVHGTSDDVVPYAIGRPFSIFTTPKVFGTQCITRQLERFGIDHTTIVLENAGHEPHGAKNGYWCDQPNEYWNEIVAAINQHCYRIVKQRDP